MSFALTLVAVALCHTNQANAARFTVLGDLSLASAKITSAQNPTVTRGIGLGLGGELELPLTENLELVAGGHYLNRKMNISALSTETVSLTGLRIPVFPRLWLFGLIGIEVGAYYTIGLGNISTTDSAKNITHLTYDQYGIDNEEFGWMSGLSINIPWTAHCSIALQGIYSQGIYDVSQSPGATFKHNDLLIQVGLRFGTAPGKN